MSGHIYKKTLLLILLALSFTAWASPVADSSAAAADEPIDQQKFIMGHIKDSHTFHICDIDGHPYGVPLPVILFAQGGPVTFMSSAFHHDDSGTYVVEKGGHRLVMYDEKIYYASAEASADGSYITRDGEGKITNSAPFDMSVTKNVVTAFMVVVIMLAVFLSVGRFYRNRENADKAPKGIAKLFEPLVVYIRDEIVRPNIGEKYYRKYTPYLLTLFFFILFTNLCGLIPFFPFGANVSGNTSFTLTLAAFTFVIVQFSGTKEYWKEIVSMPGVPKPVMLILAPVEFIGLFTKPFALTIRLFASILGGHIIILSLLLLIFVFKSWAVVPASGLFIMFMLLIELLVAVIQAYIFTLLTALYIGMAKAEPHEGH